MCGIIIVIGKPLNPPDDTLIRRRGPDFYSHLSFSSTVDVSLTASVLHLRGDHVVNQPKKINGGTLCWNGEIYHYCKSLNQKEDQNMLEIPLNRSDTDVISELLEQALKQDHHSSTLEAITSVMTQVWNGEFAFCFLINNFLYYGRDRLGRRSLLLSKSDGLTKIASVATSTEEDWEEIPPGEIFELNLYDNSIQSESLHDFDFIIKTPSIVDSDIEIPSGVTASMWNASIAFEKLLLQAIQIRLVCCRIWEPIGVLFSGGLDSVVIAGMVAKMISTHQTLELYNVAFGQEKAADREAGYRGYEDLKAAFPEKDIKLVLVDINKWEEIIEWEEHIKQLIYPKTSVMDINIGTALWFASRGVGFVDGKLYHSTAKVLLVGMGADEQLGGYGRHRKAYQKGNLREELDLDINRIWERNLGRDDRVLSDHGKEARFPFLDRNVMNFLAVTPLDNICDFSLGPGEGDKRILRLIAKRMKLTTASQLVKRAIQFGSKVAHLCDKQRFGSRRQAKGISSYDDGLQEKN